MSKMTGAEIVIECLKEQGVDTVFGYPGYTNTRMKLPTSLLPMNRALPMQLTVMPGQPEK